MPEAVAARLRSGLPLDDNEFDKLYPRWARRHSTVHWTPVVAARRAAELLVARPGLRVLDVGSGIGKFCTIGALTTTGVFYGIEQRFHFVKVARATSAVLGTKSHFLHGNMMALDWRGFEGFYFFNPFAENLTSSTEAIDLTVDRAPELFLDYLRFVRTQLAAAAPGTRVVTFHGFGGDMPPSYRLELHEPCLHDRLELWVKAE